MPPPRRPSQPTTRWDAHPSGLIVVVLGAVVIYTDRRAACGGLAEELDVADLAAELGGVGDEAAHAEGDEEHDYAERRPHGPAPGEDQRAEREHAEQARADGG